MITLLSWHRLTLEERTAALDISNLLFNPEAPGSEFDLFWDSFRQALNVESPTAASTFDPEGLSPEEMQSIAERALVFHKIPSASSHWSAASTFVEISRAFTEAEAGRNWPPE